MKTILDIPDELYRQAKVHAVQENRKIEDLVNEGLRLVLGLTDENRPRQLRRMIRRMTKAPVMIRESNVIQPVSNETMAALLERSGERLP